MNHTYTTDEPTRAELDALPGDTLLEFGAPWCPHCQAAQPLVEQALAGRLRDAPLRHLKIEDGRGRPLGRSFQIKLWPAYVVLRDGRELARVVRPAGSQAAAALDEALARLD